MQALVLNVMTGYSGGEGRCHVSCEAVGLFFERGGGVYQVHFAGMFTNVVIRS